MAERGRQRTAIMVAPVDHQRGTADVSSLLFTVCARLNTSLRQPTFLAWKKETNALDIHLMPDLRGVVYVSS